MKSKKIQFYKFGRRYVAPVQMRIVLAAFLVLPIGLLVFLKAPDLRPPVYPEIEPAAGKTVVSDLVKLHRGAKKRASLGNHSFSSFQLDTVNEKKKYFYEEVLPIFLMANEEVRLEREFLLSMREKLGQHWSALSFIGVFRAHVKLILSEIEQRRLLVLADKYRVVRAPTILERVNVLPSSLMLAQAAIESSWGTSRFAVLGNNYFGMWTWGAAGLVPRDREEGKNHKVAVYPTVLDSARAYILTLNRLPAYKELRKLRLENNDSLVLAGGLLAYSQRRQDYVDEVRQLIIGNGLKRYD